MRILIRRDSEWEVLAPTAYLSEAQLQEALAGSDTLIPGDATESEEAVVYCREFPTRSGPIDLVGIGSSGSVTVMECKLAKNPQVKREVVGQVLDYAAHLWGTDFDEFLREFAKITGRDPFERLRGRVEDAEAWDEEYVRAEVARRLGSGQFRLLIAVDEIDGGLRQIIKYMNTRSGHDQIRLVAIQFPLYRSGDAEVVVTTTYGDEAPASERRQPSSGGQRWTAEQFREAFAGSSPLLPLHDLFAEWAEVTNIRVVYGRGTIAPSVSYQYWTDERTWYPLFILWPDRGGRVEVPLPILASDSRPASKPLVSELLQRLNAIDGIDLAPFGSPKRIAIDGSLLLTSAEKAFLSTFDWFVAELRANDQPYGTDPSA